MKKVLALLLAVVMCLSVFALTGCDGNTDNTESSKNTENTENTGDAGNSGNNGGETAEVPTEAGKVTFYFTMGEGSVALPEYACVYINGTSFNNWSTQEGTAAFQRLGETNIYYAISDATLDVSNADCGGYQLTVGVTKESAEAVGASSWGTNYSYKSEECATYAGLEHPVFAYSQGDNKVDLGTHTFKNIPDAPVAPVSVKTTLKATFTEALPEGAKVLLIGELNDWNGEAMTSADGKTWTLNVSLLANTYEYKICVYTADAGLAEDFGNKWDIDRGEYGADGGANAKVTIMTVDEGQTVPLMKNLVYPVVAG